MNDILLPQVGTRLPLSLKSTLRQEISERDQRALLFGTKMLRHPVWEMLLHLAYAEFESRPISVFGLCNFIHCPQSTVLRYMRGLEKDGILTLQQDPDDKRRTFVLLSEETKCLFLEHFDRENSVH